MGTGLPSVDPRHIAWIELSQKFPVEGLVKCTTYLSQFVTTRLAGDQQVGMQERRMKFTGQVKYGCAHSANSRCLLVRLSKPNEAPSIALPWQVPACGVFEVE